MIRYKVLVDGVLMAHGPLTTSDHALEMRDCYAKINPKADVTVTICNTETMPA